MLELGYAYLSSLTLPEVAQPHMEALVAQVNESSSISVLDDTEVVYVARVPTRRIMSITLSVGTRLPAYATSMGRVLLAAPPDAELESRLARIELRPLSAHTITDPDALRAVLERVRRQGWAAVDQELEEGLRSLAVPIHDASGTVVAALNVSVHASRGTMTTLRRDILPLAQAAAVAIEADLRRSTAPRGRAARCAAEGPRATQAGAGRRPPDGLGAPARGPARDSSPASSACCSRVTSPRTAAPGWRGARRRAARRSPRPRG